MHLNAHAEALFHFPSFHSISIHADLYLRHDYCSFESFPIYVQAACETFYVVLLSILRKKFFKAFQRQRKLDEAQIKSSKKKKKHAFHSGKLTYRFHLLLYTVGCVNKEKLDIISVIHSWERVINKVCFAPTIARKTELKLGGAVVEIVLKTVQPRHSLIRSDVQRRKVGMKLSYH